MNLHMPTIIAAALLIIESAALPYLKLETLSYYDDFGDPTVFTINGGYVTVECQVDGVKAVNLLDPSGQVISSADPFLDNVLKQFRARLRLDITNTTNFGKYRCQYEDHVSADAIDLSYRFCADTDRICWDDVSKCSLTNYNPPYCIQTAKGDEPCADMQPEGSLNDWCDSVQVNETGVVYCPGNLTLCKSELEIIGAKSQVVGNSCNGPISRIHLEVNSFKVEYNQAVGLSMDEIPVYSTIYTSLCGPACRKMKVLCTLKDPSGQIVVAREYANFSQGPTEQSKNIDLLNHPMSKASGFRVHKMQCTLMNSTRIFGRLMNRIIYFGTKPVITSTTVNGTTTLRCDLVPSPPLPFRISHFSFGIAPLQSIHDNDTITKPRPGNYSCNVIIEYLRCEKRQIIYSRSFKSDSFVVVDSEVEVESNRKRDNEGGNGAMSKGLSTSYAVRLGTMILGFIQHR